LAFGFGFGFGLTAAFGTSGGDRAVVVLWVDGTPLLTPATVAVTSCPPQVGERADTADGPAGTFGR